jgi:hypothetical protein
MNISYILFETLTFVLYFPIVYVTFADMWVRRGRDRMVVGITTTYAISAHHH